MKVISLKTKTPGTVHPSHGNSVYGPDISSLPDSEWGAIQQERVENNTVLSFFILECECDAQTIALLEFKPPTMGGHVTETEVELACPNCGDILPLKLPCDMDGVKVSRLESWTKGVKVRGLERERKNPEYNHDVAKSKFGRLMDNCFTVEMRQLPDRYARILNVNWRIDETVAQQHMFELSRTEEFAQYVARQVIRAFQKEILKTKQNRGTFSP